MATNENLDDFFATALTSITHSLIVGVANALAGDNAVSQLIVPVVFFVHVTWSYRVRANFGRWSKVETEVKVDASAKKVEPEVKVQGSAKKVDVKKEEKVSAGKSKQSAIEREKKMREDEEKKKREEEEKKKRGEEEWLKQEMEKKKREEEEVEKKKREDEKKKQEELKQKSDHNQPQPPSPPLYQPSPKPPTVDDDKTEANLF